ncbi:MAG: hypothetical protein K2M46_02465 [Lachnospiraceae bacterium]|nr:hypothetical protein [Lachnospiraceae bacterium]
MGTNYDETDVDNIVALLDSYAEKGDGRIKIQMSDELEAGTSKRQYHHGRCDVGSPWAKGESFDVLECVIEDVTPPGK